MDIVFLITGIVLAGAETQLVRITTTLRRRGWNVAIVTMLPPTYAYKDLDESGIPVVQCPGHPVRSPWKMIWALVRQLRRWRPSVLVTFNYPADVLGRACGTLASTPALVTSLRTSHLKTPLRGLFYRFTDFLVTITVSNSKAAINLLTGKGILRQEKTRLIPNGMILDRYPAQIPREEARALLGVTEGEFLWVAVGNLREAKDYPTLLKAAALCAEKEPSFRLKIAGRGKLGEDLARQAGLLKLDGAVEFLGSRSDVGLIMKAADAFVLSSAWEGTPNTLMEAMASSLPAVATDVGDVRELMQGERAGFVVPPGEPGAMADRMLAIMALDQPSRHAMGRQGRLEIETNFENEKVVDQWEALFLQLNARPSLQSRKA